MSMTGQLQLGLTEVYTPGTSKVIGYAYTEASGAGQLQRWLLYRWPGNALEVRQPSPEARLTARTLDEWRSEVAKQWQPGWRYVWAQADVYSHGVTCGDGETRWTWTEIPPASQMPPPTYPDVDAEPAQIDPWCIALDVTQDERRGLVFTTADDTRVEATVEYWLLPDHYEPAGGSKSASIGAEAAGSSAVSAGVAADPGDSFQRFIDLANQSWKPGCCFVITGCVNYTGESAPANP